MKRNVIVDIDGTISVVGDRVKFLKMNPPDYDSFYESSFDDEPIEEIVNLVQLLSYNFKIIFCTSRRESVRKITSRWILNNFNGGQISFGYVDRNILLMPM